MREVLGKGLVGILLGVTLIGVCGSSGGTGSPQAVHPALGIWERTSGSLPLGGDAFDVTYLWFQADGTLSVFSREADLNILGREDGIQGYAGDTTLAIETGGGRQGGASLWMVTQNPAGADTLGLTDTYGNTATFAMRGSIPAALQPLSFSTVVRRFDDLGQIPDSRSGLVWDGSQLWFTAEDDLAYPVNPTTGVLGASMSFGSTQFEMVHAFQGGDFWNHCRCGGNETAKRLTTTGVEIDTVDTEDWITNGLNIDGIAWDPVGPALWIHAQDFDSPNGDRLLKIDSDSEPDGLLDNQVFDTQFRSMTWDGTHLWAMLANQTVVRIDVTTFKATASYLTPDPTVQWTGICSAPASAGGGSSLYLAGENSTTNQGELIELQP